MKTINQKYKTPVVNTPKSAKEKFLDDDFFDNLDSTPYEPPPAPRGITPQFIEMTFNNRSTRDCSLDHKNGYVKTNVTYPWHKEYAAYTKGIPVYDGTLNKSGAPTLIPDEYMDDLIVEFKVSVEAIMSRKKGKRGVLIVLPSMKIFEWFVAGKVTNRIQYPQSKETTVFEMERVIDLLNKNGCNNLLSVKIEDGHRLEVFNPWLNETFTINKRDVIAGWTI